MIEITQPSKLNFENVTERVVCGVLSITKESEMERFSYWVRCITCMYMYDNNVYTMRLMEFFDRHRTTIVNYVHAGRELSETPRGSVLYNSFCEMDKCY